MIHFGLEGLLPLLLYVGMYGIFVGSVLWRPSLGIYFLALTLPLQTGRYKLHAFPLGSAFLDILLLGTILGLIVRGESIIPKTNLNRYLLIFAIFCYLSLWEGSFFLNAPLPLWISDDRFSAWKNYVEMFLFALVVASSIKKKSQVVLLLAAMCLSLLVVNRSNYSVLSHRDLSHFSYEVRESGPLGYAGVNGLATFEAMAAAFLLGIYAYTKKILRKLGILLVLATCGYCLLFSFSRGGYLGFLVGLITVGLLKTRWFLVLAVVIVVGWQTLLPESVQERITMTTADAADGQRFDSSSQERIDLWADAWNLFKRNPVTGTGFETYGHLGRLGYSDTHNYYVKVLAETGVVGLLLYLFLLWKLFRTGWALFSGAVEPFWRAIALGFIAVMASITVMNLFGDRWAYQQVDGYLWILLGCVIRGLIVLREEPEGLVTAGGDNPLPVPDEASLATV